MYFLAITTEATEPGELREELVKILRRVDGTGKVQIAEGVDVADAPVNDAGHVRLSEGEGWVLWTDTRERRLVHTLVRAGLRELEAKRGRKGSLIITPGETFV